MVATVNPRALAVNGRSIAKPFLSDVTIQFDITMSLKQIVFTYFLTAISFLSVDDVVMIFSWRDRSKLASGNVGQSGVDGARRSLDF